MLRLLSRIAVIAVSSSVVVPYTAAVLCHLLYSRQPLKTGSMVRSLHPKRVYALTVVLVKKLMLTARYAPLYFQWRQYYITADPSVTVKNLTYGRNHCCLDLHLPASHRLSQATTKPRAKPVLMFLYGGSWSSGDKSMYGALCAHLAEQLDVLVCCPNYSTYPQGCVDDMIQDIVDCIQWIYDNIHDYGGDKSQMMMVGHSAGAHLGSMALLELLHDQRLHAGPFPPEVAAAAGMLFHESYYGRMASDPGKGPKDPLEDSSGSSESFAVVSENSGDNGDSEASHMDSSLVSIINTSMVEVARREQPPPPPPQGEGPSAQPASKESGVTEAVPQDTASTKKADDGKHSKHEAAEGEEESCEEEDDNDSIVTVRPKDIERHSTLSELAESVKAFIGLAGVYHIGDHLQHETYRGVDHLSGMTPAMYGPDHFERFSPTTILLSLDTPISLPRMVLVHGLADDVVPVRSSQRLAEALARVSASVHLHLVPDCDHYDVCFDLMTPSRRFHPALMTLLLDTANSVF